MDGPYVRVMKARKWLYLASGAALFLHLNLYVERAASDLLKVVKLPAWVLQHGLALGLAYMLIQYALLLTQLGSTYDIVLRERFSDRRQSELEAAQSRLAAAEKAFRDLSRELRSPRGVDLADLATDPEDKRQLQMEAAEARDRRLSTARNAIVEAEKAYDNLMRTHPANRSLYRWSEVAVDLLRTAPPLAIGAVYLALTVKNIFN